MTTSSSDLEKFAELLESATSPQPPLTDAELRQVRAVLIKEGRTAWIKKQILLWTPWVLAITGLLGAFVNWLLHNIRLVDQSTP